MSFPIDESAYGVYDLAGSVSEWIDDWWIEERGQRKLFGGSWGHGGGPFEEMFGIYGYNGMAPGGTTGTIGFRQVARPTPPEHE